MVATSRFELTSLSPSGCGSVHCSLPTSVNKRHLPKQQLHRRLICSETFLYVSISYPCVRVSLPPSPSLHPSPLSPSLPLSLCVCVFQEYLAAYGGRALDEWKRRISDHNLSSARFDIAMIFHEATVDCRVRLIASVPGAHTGAERNRWGHLKLGKVVYAFVC